ncbi:MAG: cobalt-factor II C(20)-methyltransferase [Methanomassiliicoccales archaeon]|nr:MAG: cobalt-factor II C(20)-methyltransferase [Methanomassiliicoccales archaeon]
MLVALGLGPGDSELITVRGARLLRTADKVFVPGEIARRIVLPYVDPELLDFPMTNDEDAITKAMERNSDRIAKYALNGTAVLGILGDPSFFSTYGRLYTILKQRYPSIECTVEPGISSITAFAAKMGVAVNSGLEVSDGSEKACRVLLKVRRPRETVEKLRKEGFKEFVLAERMYMDGEKIYGESDMPEVCDYMSVLFARR